MRFEQLIYLKRSVEFSSLESNNLCQCTSSRSFQVKVIFKYSIITSSLKIYCQVRKKYHFFVQPICTGLCHDKYNTNLFDPAESESAHDRLPLSCDPALVCAAQLDILKLQNHPTENIQSRVQQIVHAFGSTEKDFKASLRPESCRNGIWEYKTSTKSRL